MCALWNTYFDPGYVWVRRWNERGYDGLKENGNQGGRPAKLSENDLKRLEEILKEKDYWTTKEVRKEIIKKFGVDLSVDTVVRILRHKLGPRFSKPYPIDYRRPADAEALLENQLHLVFMLLKEKGISEDEIAIGFVDEMRLDLKIIRTRSKSGVLIESESRRIHPDSRRILLDSMPSRGKACKNSWMIPRVNR